MAAPNPYEAPQFMPTSTPPSAPYTGDACPRCQSTEIEKPSFTMWGGAIGPQMFHHTICQRCGFGFNSVTGKSNTRAIWMYRGVTWSIAIAGFALYCWLRTSP